jgi:hypothetical protein
MNLLYLPTIIGLIMKYGPYLSTAEAVLKQFSPLAQQVIGAVAPIIQKELETLNVPAATDPASVVSGVQAVLQSLGHPALSPGEEDVLTNRLSQMS